MLYGSCKVIVRLACTAASPPEIERITKNRINTASRKSSLQTNPKFTTFFCPDDNFPIQITRRETLDDNRRGNGIGAYYFCIILLLILALTPFAAAADTMFRANAEHPGVFDNGGI